MSEFDYDLFVIGAGSGGVRASRMAAQMGVKVAIAEDTHLGGTCVNVGCVPKKLFVYGSHFAEEFHAAAGFGWNLGSVSLDWPTLRDNKTREIERLNNVYRGILENAGVSLIEGRATIEGPHTIRVGDHSYRAQRILVATGGIPSIPAIEGSEHIISSNEAFYLDRLPKQIVIVGGGYIAVEFAGIFNGLGVETHLVHRGDSFLKAFDKDLQEHLVSEMTKKGIHIHLQTNVRRIEKCKEGSEHPYTVHFTNDTEVEADQVMYATGRQPRVDGLGLENTAVELDKTGAIKVNDHFQSNEPSIYAIGDVINRVQLTPVALAEGMALVRHLYQHQPITLSYDNIPTAVFSQPNLATVGVSEDQARERGLAIKVFKTSFKHMKHTLSGIDERTFMKVIVDVHNDKVLGCHMIGADAGEIIQGLAIAIKAGATKADFDETIGIHPSAAEEFVTLREPV